MYSLPTWYTRVAVIGSHGHCYAVVYDSRGEDRILTAEFGGVSRYEAWRSAIRFARENNIPL